MVGFRTVVASRTRGKTIAFAPTAPSASAPSRAGSVRLVRAKVNVTFVDEIRPPSRPVTR